MEPQKRSWNVIEAVVNDDLIAFNRFTGCLSAEEYDKQSRRWIETAIELKSMTIFRNIVDQYEDPLYRFPLMKVTEMGSVHFVDWIINECQQQANQANQAKLVSFDEKELLSFYNKCIQIAIRHGYQDVFLRYLECDGIDLNVALTKTIEHSRPEMRDELLKRMQAIDVELQRRLSRVMIAVKRNNLIAFKHHIEEISSSEYDDHWLQMLETAVQFKSMDVFQYVGNGCGDDNSLYKYPLLMVTEMGNTHFVDWILSQTSLLNKTERLFYYDIGMQMAIHHGHHDVFMRYLECDGIDFNAALKKTVEHNRQKMKAELLKRIRVVKQTLYKVE